MTRKERLKAIFEGTPVDRPAVKLWNAQPGQELLHPAYRPVHEAAMGRTDLMIGAGSPFHLWCGKRSEKLVHTEQTPTQSEEWVDCITSLDTPGGTLRRVFRRSTCKKPGYEMEHLLKEPNDIKKLLSLPYEPYPFSSEDSLKKEASVGERGLVVFGLDHAMYGLQWLIGSENFALWSIECRELMLEAMTLFAKRIRDHAARAIEAGISPFFGWVGPELCIPPLMSVRDFDEFVLAFDKPLCELIHNAGGRAWVHCHGKMGLLLERFVEMGADVLNPVEPPPMGDVTLEEAFTRVGDRMALEGNIETHDIMTAPPDLLAAKIHDVLLTGSRKGRRFILCPTSGYMEDPTPSDLLINNLLLFIEEGVRFSESLAR